MTADKLSGPPELGIADRLQLCERARVEAIHVARCCRCGFGRMIAWRLALMVVVAVLVAVGCGTASAAASTGAAAKSSRAARITAIVKRSVVVPSQVNGVVYGVWQHGHRIVSGALGKAQAGVAARPNMHVRIGNTAESMLATMLLRFVDQGKLSLNDRLSKWYPNLPNADKVTLQM